MFGRKELTRTFRSINRSVLMQRKLLRLGNLPKSGAFIFRDLPFKVEVTQLGSDDALKCDLKLRWQPWRGLQLLCHDIGDGLKPFEKPGTKARVEGKIADGPLAGWSIVAPGTFSLRSHAGSRLSITRAVKTPCPSFRCAMGMNQFGSASRHSRNWGHADP